MPEEALAKMGGMVVLLSTGSPCQKTGNFFWARAAQSCLSAEGGLARILVGAGECFDFFVDFLGCVLVGDCVFFFWD